MKESVVFFLRQSSPGFSYSIIARKHTCLARARRLALIFQIKIHTTFYADYIPDFKVHEDELRYTNW